MPMAENCQHDFRGSHRCHNCGWLDPMALQSLTTNVQVGMAVTPAEWKVIWLQDHPEAQDPKPPKLPQPKKEPPGDPYGLRALKASTDALAQHYGLPEAQTEPSPSDQEWEEYKRLAGEYAVTRREYEKMVEYANALTTTVRLPTASPFEYYTVERKRV